MKVPTGVLVAALLAVASAGAGEIVRDGAFARWDARTLRVGNGRFEAGFRMGGGMLRLVSLSADGVERLRGGAAAGGDELTVAEAEPQWSAAGERELALSVASCGGQALVRVWPRANGPVVEQAAAAPLPPRPGHKEWGSRVFSFGWSRFKSLDACGDAVSFAAPHLVARAYTPIDRTDLRAELLDVREFAMPTCEAMAYLKCGVLDVRETLTGRGVVFLKLAPMPESRAEPDAFDFAVNPSTRAVMAVPTGCPLAALAYSGGEVGRLRALRDFHRSLWPRRPGRDGVLLSNTWGDGNRDSRINEGFLLGEIAAAADIGVEVVQIDDGWQKGRSANSSQSGGKGVWNGYWAADPEFWAPDPVRFPRGLRPLADAAGGNGRGAAVLRPRGKTDPAGGGATGRKGRLGGRRGLRQPEADGRGLPAGPFPAGDPGRHDRRRAEGLRLRRGGRADLRGGRAESAHRRLRHRRRIRAARGRGASAP